MGNSYIPFLILLLIILGQSCVLLLLFLKTRQRIHNLTDEMHHLRNETQSSKDETGRLEEEAQRLASEAENLRQRLNESDRKNEEDRKTLKMLMISDLGNDISGLEKKGMPDEKLRVLLGRVKENISKTEDV